MKQKYPFIFLLLFCINSFSAEDTKTFSTSDYKDNLKATLSDFCKSKPNDKICKLAVKVKVNDTSKLADEKCYNTSTIKECIKRIQSKQNFIDGDQTTIDKVIKLIFNIWTMLGSIFATIGYYINKLNKQLNEYWKFLYDPIFGNKKDKIKKIYKGVNVILIGKSGSGKTSIIRALTGVGDADPAFATNSLNVYSITQEASIEIDKEKKKRILRMYIEDYKGQDQGQRGELEEIKKREALYPSTVFVYVVDVVQTQKKYPDDGVIRPAIKLKSPDMERVAIHIKFLDTDRFSSHIQLSTKLKKVILFINKIDTILPINNKTLDEIKACYQTAIDDMALFYQDFDFCVILGSAAFGKGVSGHEARQLKNVHTLFEHFVQSSVEPTK